MSKEEESSTSHIFQSLAVNLLIALVKTGAAVFTRSGSMLAEALHSFSDCGNQLLLLVGVRQAKKPPDAAHPFGYGRALYFWSFMVALLLFLGGGVFSVYEGIEKVLHPAEVEHVWVGVLILLVSMGLEGAATLSNIKELNKRRGPVPFMAYLRQTKDSDLVVVFAENSAAVFGLGLAIAALALAALTHDGRWDGAGSIGIGLVLVGVAVFLAVEVKSLLIGESADAHIEGAVREHAEKTEGFRSIIHVRTVQQGPGEVLVAVKATFDETLTVPALAERINVFEAALRAAHPEVKWLYVEPDTLREEAEAQAARLAAEAAAAAAEA
jgi:cation diffusion facilitator family transporter